MAQRIRFLSDDGSPIKIGDSGTLPPPNRRLQKLLGTSPHIYLSERQCFHQLAGGLGVQNDNYLAVAVVVADQPYKLVAPWSIVLNGELTLLSLDSKTIRFLTLQSYAIAFGTVVFGSKNLKTAVLYTPSGATKLPISPGVDIRLKFARPR